ncbi:MAG: general secretion pathway protein GspK [Deltaproteobacteria bacterium]|nr:general secretion pathway protein GspK [Deltaproteobacteria bacterium]
MKKLSNKEGIALITTLMIIALLVATVIEFNRIAIADIDISRNFGDEKKILFTTISGINAIKEVLRLEGLYDKSDTLFNKWAKSRPYFDAANSMLDEGRVEGEIVDEDGKIYVNSLINDKGGFNPDQKAIWERLLTQSKFALTEEVVNTIINSTKDWIDKDDKITGIYGAEDPSYQGKGYHCKNNPLNNLEEMLLINGVTQDIFYGNQDKSGIKSCFTVYGGGLININTAPIPVLMALSDDMTEDIAMELDDYRRDETNKPALGNKQWYRKVWSFEKPLPENILTTSSSFFTVHMRGTLRESVKEIRTVISRSNVAANIVFWQEM